jgi:zinc and cadmium transporter
MSVWAAALASVLVVSMIPLAGLAALAVDRRRVEALTPHLVSFAVGALLGGATLHLLPAALEGVGRRGGVGVWLLFLLGFVGFFVLEESLWAHGHRVTRPGDGAARNVAVLNLVGDGLHNLLDGMVLAASYLADPAVGVAATVAVVLHEVPQEVGDFGILMHGGFTVRRAILLNVLTAITAVAGATAVLVVGQRAAGVAAALLPVAAGGFVYIAASDLVPELQRMRGVASATKQLALIALGIGLMAAVRLLE